jgi:hypothetical protein
MPNAFKNKKLASEAGKKSKRGPSEKTILWEMLGDLLINEGSERVMNFIKNCDDETFLRHYKDLLEYFKPKLQRTDVTSGDKPLPSPFEGMTFEQLYELKYGRKPDRSGSDQGPGKV